MVFMKRVSDKRGSNNRPRSLIVALVALVALASPMGALTACSSSSGDTPGTTASATTPGPSTNASNCPTWTGALDAYGGADIERKGASGALTFVLTSIMPAPPATGTLTWTLKILDASGQPVKDATMTSIKTWMPVHGHGSGAVPVASNNGDGTYTIDNVYLYMAGVWQVTFDVKSGATTDSAMFSFCLGT
jgi:hypothetical protein